MPRKLKSKERLSKWTHKVLKLRGKGVTIHKGKRGGYFYIKNGRKIYLS